MITLNGNFYTMTEIARDRGVSRQRVHVIIKKAGITGIPITAKFSLFTEEEYKKLTQ
jgi:predicted DNA-binding protein YlxM (UPF0122 family)